MANSSEVTTRLLTSNIIVFVILLSCNSRGDQNKELDSLGVPNELFACIASAEVNQKTHFQNKLDNIENALTRLRLALPIDEIPSDKTIWTLSCDESVDIETTQVCEYGLYESKHPELRVLNHYSIGPYQIRPTIALRMEPYLARKLKTAPRSPKVVLESLLDSEKAKLSVAAYLLYLKDRAHSDLPKSVWATLYNEGQIEYRKKTRGDRILTKVNRFGRLVDNCIKLKSKEPSSNHR